jgi:hypothetical protein
MSDTLKGMAGTHPCECGTGDVYPGHYLCHSCTDERCERLRGKTLRQRMEEAQKRRELEASGVAWAPFTASRDE